MTTLNMTKQEQRVFNEIAVQNYIASGKEIEHCQPNQSGLTEEEQLYYASA